MKIKEYIMIKSSKNKTNSGTKDKVSEDWFTPIGILCKWDVIQFTKTFLQNQVDLQSYKDWRLQVRN